MNKLQILVHMSYVVSPAYLTSPSKRGDNKCLLLCFLKKEKEPFLQGGEDAKVTGVEKITCFLNTACSPI